MSAETFDTNNHDDVKMVDPLYAAQKEGVARMRTSLLSCMVTDNGTITSRAINNITALRIYHQIARIIKYLDLMDKLEDKLYESIERNIDNMNPDSIDTMEVLLEVQTKLQKSMIESHKLLQPYMDLQDMSIVDLVAVSTADEESSNSEISLLPSESRDRIRNSAQSLLNELRQNQEKKESMQPVSDDGDLNG